MIGFFGPGGWRFVGGIAAALGAALPALACEAPPSASYVIQHETIGEIGRHDVAFRCEGRELVVETESEVEVKALFVKLYERQGQHREVWRGDRLIAYDATVAEGDETFEVSARPKGGKLEIDGIEANVAAPLEAVSNHPWNEVMTRRSMLFGMRTGELLEFETEGPTADVIEIGARRIDARKYQMSGDNVYELWYDQDGNWLQWRQYRDGAAITLTRRS